jgi:hypothetical protein
MQPASHWFLASLSSILKTETLRSCGMSAEFQRTTRSYIADYRVPIFTLSFGSRNCRQHALPSCWNSYWRTKMWGRISVWSHAIRPSAILICMEINTYLPLDSYVKCNKIQFRVNETRYEFPWDVYSKWSLHNGHGTEAVTKYINSNVYLLFLKILFNYLRKISVPCGGGLNTSIAALQTVEADDEGAQCLGHDRAILSLANINRGTRSSRLAVGLKDDNLAL